MISLSKAANAGDKLYYSINDSENMNQQSNLTNEQQATLYSYLTVNQFCEKHKAFKIGGVRAQIFNAETTGLAKSGAIVRIGRKVLIDEAKFFAWVEAQNQGGAK